MEIQLVHTTGSPSRHDSDSESSYDKNRHMKSSSEMALHRKQSRRCKKQMSERQRRKRMNNSMDKLGLLVYGKSFKDGLKVDKATLLKDAYEKLQTMKDDYHKGYETAITSTQTFLDRLEGCPQGVKDALTRHLHSTLQHHMHRCLPATDPLLPLEDTHSDSCSPKPLSSTALEIQSELEILRDAPSDLSPRGSPYSRSMTSGVSQETAVPRMASRQEGVLSRARLADIKLSPSLRTVADVKPFVSRAVSELKSPSCRSRPDSTTPTFRAVGEVVPLAVYTCSKVSSHRGEVDHTDTKPSIVCPPRVAAIPTASSSSSSSSSSSRCLTSWEAVSVQSADPHAPRQGQSVSAARGGAYSQPTYPFPYLYSSSSPSSAMPRISPYVTPFAPQDPLYLGSTPPSLTHHHPHAFPTAGSSPSHSPEAKPSLPLQGAPSHSALHPHTPAVYGGHIQVGCGGSSHAADDSGYISPVVPSPVTPISVAQYGGVKKRYLKEMVRGRRGRGAEEETDDENDREVERVFSRGGKDDSDTGSGFSE